MGNDGKSLERFVAQVEKVLLPKGFKITPNKKFYDDNGIQTLELDILVEGRVGTTDLKWLIECRDRPSAGSAPRSWIEQLIGRRNDLNLNKVIAVSTTGFSDSAKSLAEKHGIDMRTVTEANIDDISEWFQLEKFILYNRLGKLNYVKLIISEDEPEEIKRALKKKLTEITGDEKILCSNETGECISTGSAFLAAVKEVEQSYFDGLDEDGESIEFTLLAKYPRDDSHFTVLTDAGPVRIIQILFKGEVSITTEEVPISSIKKYEDSIQGKGISTVASFDFEMKGKPLELSFHNDSESGVTTVVLAAPKLKE